MLELTTTDLTQAAANLTRMRSWVTDLYPLCIEYEEAVFHALGSTKQNGNWTNFIINIFIDVAVGLLAAAALAAEGPAAIPALAFMSAVLHDWGIGKDKPNNLPAFFAVFEFGHQQMQFEIEQKLSALSDPTSNYHNLQEAWKSNIVFNGATYTISDLASSHFPGLGDEYNKLQSAANTAFKKSLWNLAIMKTCSYYENYHQNISLDSRNSIINYAQKMYYPANKGVYLTMEYIHPDENTFDFILIAWNLGIGGYALSDEASEMLFMDDTPGNIINPKGLFSREFVFEQFTSQKPDFEGGRPIMKVNGLMANDFTFTGGMFPKLVKK